MGRGKALSIHVINAHNLEEASLSAVSSDWAAQAQATAAEPCALNSAPRHHGRTPPPLLAPVPPHLCIFPSSKRLQTNPSSPCVTHPSNLHIGPPCTAHAYKVMMCTGRGPLDLRASSQRANPHPALRTKQLRLQTCPKVSGQLYTEGLGCMFLAHGSGWSWVAYLPRSL